MASQTPLYQTVDTIVADILAVIQMMEDLPPGSGNALETYKKNCRRIPEQIRSNRIKIAVVGAIKSGKSTLVNAIIGKELVKMGAGVVTAITTRIRKGARNRATVFFKSWDDINRTLRNTLEMFPKDKHAGQKTDIAAFDLRREKDRAFLQQVYENLVKDFPVTEKGIRPEILVIRNALEGYETCRDFVGPDRGSMVFDAKQFGNHKLFTGDPANAFYVRDVCLELYGKVLEPHIEIADCQGADSTDPAQLTQILDYVQDAGLILYCISSRTGLRQADLQFLELIRKLGLAGNMIFINNCDLSEHETLADLQAVENQTRQDLGLLVTEPELYAFSALLDLFCTMEARLRQRQRKRLDLWQEDTAMAEYSKKSADRFFQRFSAICRHHYRSLLVAGHLERLLSMVASLEEKALLFSQVLASDMNSRKKAEKQLEQVRNNVTRLRSIVEHSVPGAVSGLTREIGAGLDKSFARDTVHIRKKIRAYIRRTPLDAAPYKYRAQTLGINKIFYLMFQDFKRELDLFVIEQVLPDIKALVAENEARVETYFQSLLDSYQVDFFQPDITVLPDGAPVDVQQTAANHGETAMRVDVQAIKKILGLVLPRTGFSPDFTSRMQTGAFAGMGVNILLQLLSVFKDKTWSFSVAPGFDAAAVRIKKHCLAAADLQIDLFHERLKNRYFVPLIQAAARDFSEKIQERFSLYASLDADMEEMFDLRQTQKQREQEKITTMLFRLQQIRMEIERIT
ncbi:MAG TPA: dynamin family protein [Desulfotignum sp.]|nr:dynamin family protein [Desulfotignum sp.]